MGAGCCSIEADENKNPGVLPQHHYVVPFCSAVTPTKWYNQHHVNTNTTKAVPSLPLCLYSSCTALNKVGCTQFSTFVRAHCLTDFCSLCVEVRGVGWTCVVCQHLMHIRLDHHNFHVSTMKVFSIDMFCASLL